MGEFNKAAEISRANLEPMTNIDSIENACFLAQLGIIISRKGDQNTALSYLEKALKIFEKRLLLNDPTIVMVETSIGDVYRLLGDYPTALLHSKKGLETSCNLMIQV